MDERTFLDRLEHLICRALSEAEGDDRRCHWCDGVIISLELLGQDPPRLEGKAWVGGIPGERRGTQEDWPFVLWPDPSAIEGGRISWQKLADACEGTQWLQVDWEDKAMAVDLRADRVHGVDEESS